MFARSRGSACEVLAPAKLNLTLRIVGRRTDGFHELETIMAPVSLYDRLVYRPAEQEFRFRCESPGDAVVAPAGPENLACRALVRLAEAAGVEPRGDFLLVKQIPAAAGMGGGSSDAAAALRLANHAWRLNWSDAALAPMALELGSDVPFFLGGRPALCRGRGERIERLPRLPSLPIVAVKPPEGVSTPAAFAALGLSPGEQVDVTESGADAALAVATLASARWSALRGIVANGLQRVAERLCESVARVRREFESQDVVAHCMTGSGSASFAICRSMRHAQRVAARVRTQELGTVFVAATRR